MVRGVRVDAAAAMRSSLRWSRRAQVILLRDPVACFSHARTLLPALGTRLHIQHSSCSYCTMVSILVMRRRRPVTRHWRRAGARSARCILRQPSQEGRA